MATENALLAILVEKINNDTLVLPTLPAIALKVRKAADDPDINLNAMAEVIGQDPSLSARMVKISNSAYLSRAVKITSAQQAVTRIGLVQIKNISTALAMEQLFVSKNEIIKRYMNRMWEETIEVVANSLAILQMYTKQTKDRTLKIESMMLTALIHNIGALPILTEAERHPDAFANATFLDAAIVKMSGKIGASIMTEWGFDQEFIDIAQHWNNLTVNTEAVSYLDIVRLGAVLSGKLDEQKGAVAKAALAKGIVSDLADLQSDEFKELRANGKQIFM